MPEIERTLGEHGARIAALEKDVTRMEEKLDRILETLSEAKGGWKMLMMVGGASATIGGLIATLLAKWLK